MLATFVNNTCIILSLRHLLTTINTMTNRHENIFSIENVPMIFKHDEFDLSNIHTFNQVVGPDLEKLKDLQQTYTDHLDLVEEMLASQITERSGDFFQVMSSIDSVMDELSSAIKNVSSIRREFATINKRIIEPNLRNVSLGHAKNNLVTLADTLNHISNLCKVQQQVQILLSSSAYIAAIDLIDKSQKTLDEKYSKVISMRHLKPELQEVGRNIIGLIEVAANLPEKVIANVQIFIEEQLANWSAKPPPRSPPFQAITKHFMYLHENLEDVMLAEELLKLFTSFNAIFINCFAARLNQLNITNVAGPQQFIVTQELTFYKASLSQLKVFENFEFDFKDIWIKPINTNQSIQ